MSDATPSDTSAHGTRTSYNHGCRGDDCPARPRCHEIAARQKKRTALRRAGVLPIGESDFIPAGPAVEHLARLLALPHTSARQIASLADVAQKTIDRLSHRPPRVRSGVARRLLALTEDRVRTSTYHEPAAPIRRLCRSMQAQGFTVDDIARRVGTQAGRLFADDSDLMTRTLADKVRALATELDCRQGPSPRSAAYARALGYYPLAAYDEHGNLIPEAVRHEPAEARKEKRDTAARHRLYALCATLKGVSSSQIADTLGCNPREVTRWRSDSGLTAAALLATGPRPGDARMALTAWLMVARHAPLLPALTPLAAQLLSAARIAHLADVLAAHEANHAADPYETCLAIGLMTGPNWRIRTTPRAAAA